MKVVISDNKFDYEFYDVPNKISKAILALLREYENYEDNEYNIVSAVYDKRWDNDENNN